MSTYFVASKNRQVVSILLAVGALLPCTATGCVPPEEAVTCDRAISRDVRRIVWEFLTPESGVELPAGCPLSPAADRYRQQEAAKEALAQGHWRCGLCGKRFVGEQYLDRHLASRHAHLEGNSSDSCLADWHAVLHTTHLTAYLAGIGGWQADPLPCRPAVSAQLQATCLELAARCYPSSQGRGSLQRLYALLSGQLCKAHTCDKRRKRSRLQAAAQTHQKRQGTGGLVTAAVVVTLVAFWLVLWLVCTDGGSSSPTYRQVAAARRRLAAAAVSGGRQLVLPTAAERSLLDSLGDKLHRL